MIPRPGSAGEKCQSAQPSGSHDSFHLFFGSPLVSAGGFLPGRQPSNPMWPGRKALYSENNAKGFLLLEAAYEIISSWLEANSGGVVQPHDIEKSGRGKVTL